MKVIFMGTPAFALPGLRRLASSHHRVLAVVTQPDRPRGRSSVPSPPPIKLLASELGLKLIQTPNVNEETIVRELRALNPDLLVVIAFGQKLSTEVLRLARFGSINLHASILPRYRGAAPIQWAIIKGETETGVTAIRMTDQMDAGDIIAQDFLEVGPEEIAGELESRLSELAASLLMRVLEGFELLSIYFYPQRQALVSLAPRLKREDGLISWAQEAKQVHDFIRGMTPAPGAYSFLKRGDSKRRVIILRSRLAGPEPSWFRAGEEAPGEAKGQPPGTIIQASQDGILVATSRGGLWITQLKEEGGRAMTAQDYLRGHRLQPGESFLPDCH